MNEICSNPLLVKMVDDKNKELFPANTDEAASECYDTFCEDPKLDAFIFERKTALFNEILEKSPYASMSELFKKVLIQIIMKLDFDSYEFVKVPLATVGLIVGVKGTTIKYIQDMTATKIISPSREMQPIFTILGESDSVKLAKEAISNYANSKLLPNLPKRKMSLGERIFSNIGNNELEVDGKNVKSRLSCCTPICKSIQNTGVNEFSRIPCYSKKFIELAGSPIRKLGIGGRGLQDESEKRRCTSTLETGKGYIRGQYPNNLLDGVRNEENKNRPKSFSSYMENKTSITNLEDFIVQLNQEAQKQTEREDAPFCMICFGSDNFTRLMPCGNGPFCEACSEKIVQNGVKCPICNMDVHASQPWRKE